MGNPYRTNPSRVADIDRARETGRHVFECEHSDYWTCDGYLGEYDTYICPCPCHAR